MPQMAPMWWSTLFLFFIMCFFLMMIKSYFMIKYTSQKMKNMKKESKMTNWKW
uniref:ATP synthase complex subunit 8 n=1 Tax=Saldula burmanica TaxID=2126072 RepID=A0A343W8W8_9HEMI|nr:ATP synthase F0 subunit 8 [Saldula burmanica]AVZ00808.1 ATP synthase F0 subunit 8 [Saldula burmanica]